MPRPNRFKSYLGRECTGKGCPLGFKKTRLSTKTQMHYARAMHKAGTTNACKKWGQRYHYWLEKMWHRAPQSVKDARERKMQAADRKRIWHCGLTPQPMAGGLLSGRVTSGPKPKARYMKLGPQRRDANGAVLGRLWVPHKFRHGPNRWREEGDGGYVDTQGVVR